MNVSFKNAAGALSDLNNLRQAQEDEKAWFYQWTKATGNYLTAASAAADLGAYELPISHEVFRGYRR